MESIKEIIEKTRKDYEVRESDISEKIEEMSVYLWEYERKESR